MNQNKDNTLTTIISITVCLTVSGQQISQSNNRYHGNDALERNWFMNYFYNKNV